MVSNSYLNDKFLLPVIHTQSSHFKFRNNIGLEFALVFLHSRFSGSLTYFKKITRSQILPCTSSAKATLSPRPTPHFLRGFKNYKVNKQNNIQVSPYLQKRCYMFDVVLFIFYRPALFEIT